MCLVYLRLGDTLVVCARREQTLRNLGPALPEAHVLTIVKVIVCGLEVCLAVSVAVIRA